MGGAIRAFYARLDGLWRYPCPPRAEKVSFVIPTFLSVGSVRPKCPRLQVEPKGHSRPSIAREDGRQRPDVARSDTHRPSPRRDAPDRARGRKGMTAILSHDVKQPSTQHISFPRRIFAPGVLQFSTPNEGWAERRQAHRCSGTGWPAIARQDARERAYDVAGRAPSGVPASPCDRGRAPLCAPYHCFH
jgi:hypothetical protein